MATPITCVCFFGSVAGKGWSEKHVINAGSPPGPLLPFLLSFKTLMDDKRRPLLASDCYLKGLRVSYVTELGNIASSPYRYVPYSFPANNKNGTSSSIAAKVRFGEAQNEQFSDTYLRGFWDNVEHDEELDFTSIDGAAWLVLLNQYKDALVQNGYGWWAQDELLTRRGVVESYTIGVDNFITFTLTKESGPVMPAVGSIRQFRPAKLNKSNSILNKPLTVEVVDATHVKTTSPRAALPFTSKGIWTMPGWSFTPYTGIAYTILAKKSMGAPFLSSPARKKDQPVG